MSSDLASLRTREVLRRNERSALEEQRFETEGAEPLSMSPDDLGRFIAAETIKWARVVKDAGIHAE